MTPLHTAIEINSIEVFKLLLDLDANPFFKPSPQHASAIDTIVGEALSLIRINKDKSDSLFEWLMKDKDSPLFTWEKLKSNVNMAKYFNFDESNLSQLNIDQLPIHIAIKTGRIDLVKGIIKEAGSLQLAGDTYKTSVLRPAILNMLTGEANSEEILTFLLEQGGDVEAEGIWSLPLIVYVQASSLFELSDVKEEKILAVIQLLVKFGAKLDATNGTKMTLPMQAMSFGYESLFNFFLERVNEKILNQKSYSSCLLFQVFSRYDNKLKIDRRELIAKLKNKGLSFDKTIYYYAPANPWGKSDKNEADAENMSVLHFYIHSLIDSFNSCFYRIDEHLEIIQLLIANGANPNVKAKFNFKKETMELSPAEYLKKVASQIHDDGYLFVNNPEEQQFLRQISYRDKKDKIRLHKIFHHFRNLERALSGKSVLAYTGFPDNEKLAKQALQKNEEKSQLPNESESIFESLISARDKERQNDWKALKQSLVNYVKNAPTLEAFLERIEQFKQELQLHYDLSKNGKGETVYGSTLYRFFHYFNTHKFPNSWEQLRAFGQDNYGVDINTPYEEKSNDYEVY
ncbi:MAG: hypothetical protein LCH30_08000 [Proteobacteria bacterium]|nr:hypothetical protein [Pseudomonadota bacterium]